MMEMKRIELNMITGSEFCAFARIEQAYTMRAADLHQLKREFQRYHAYGFYQDGTPVGFVVLDPNCVYFGGCLLVKKLRYVWQLNQEEPIAWMLCSAAAAEQGREWIAMDVKLKRELNLDIFYKVGFQVSTMFSPEVSGNRILIAQRETLAAKV